MRLIDADALGVTDFELALCGGDYKELCKTLIAKVESAPVIDAVPVVRCKDCKYCHIEDEYEAWCHGGLPAVLTRATEDFCSHGQRREEGDA